MERAIIRMFRDELGRLYTALVPLDKAVGRPVIAPRGDGGDMDVPKLIARFEQLHSTLLGQVPAEDAALVRAGIDQRPTTGRTYGFEDVGDAAKARLETIAVLPGERSGTASQALIAGLAARDGARLGDGLPPKVKERSVVALEQLLGWLTEKADAGYGFPDDHFLKDYRFVTGMTVPCGAQVVDLAERPGRKTVLALAPRTPLIAWRALTQPWFRPHTEDRYLVEFNEDGWNRCYAEIGDLLAAMPGVTGMIATSWFYDPALSEISPRLAYLRGVPCDAGAVAVSHGTTNFDIKSSTATSPTRRALYDEGKYMPTCWSILWPREPMLAWCARYRQAAVDGVTPVA